MAQLNIQDSLILIIDIQEKLLNAVFNKNSLEKKAGIISRAANTLEIPVVVTEQYPKGLGSTVTTIKDATDVNTKYFEKTAFSALESPEILQAIKQYNKKQNSYIGTGHVKIWFDEYYAQGPKVSVFPDAATGKPNEVYFVGRSKIVQADKDIIADKIKMTMEPKDFVAEGNVRTIIHNIDTKEEDL